MLPGFGCYRSNRGNEQQVMTIFTACAVKAKGGKECLIESGEICPEREESYSAGKEVSILL